MPRLRVERRAGVHRPLKVWSAACSCGAEPYTTAMVLAEQGQCSGGLRFTVLGTDICTAVLKQAVNAVYPLDMVAPVPPELHRRYLMRARDPMESDLDVIFCRNILIYFDKETQWAVLQRLCRHLRPGGYLFLGHAESMTGAADLPVQPVAATVFRRV